jgi:hypothetical protein
MAARLWSWLKAFLHWLAEPRPLWLALLVLVPALCVSLRPGATDLQIRLTGMVLQWLGIGTVAHGVHQTRKLFGRPSLVDSLRQWFSRFPRWRRPVTVEIGAGALGLGGLSARLHVWSNVDPAAPVEVQLNALKQNAERMNERLNQMQDEVDRELHQHSEELRREREARGHGDKDLHLRLEAAETGGLHITFVGLLWLLVGVLLATIPQEIERWRS